jgi:hypothetical protein
MRENPGVSLLLADSLADHSACLAGSMVSPSDPRRFINSRDIHVEVGDVNCRACARDMSVGGWGDGRMTLKRYLGIFAFLLGGCQSAQLTSNTIDVSATIAPIYVAQVLGNFSKFVDQPENLPSQATLQAGIVQTTNTLTPSISFPLSNMFANAMGNTITRTTTTAGAGMTIGASIAWQQNFTVQPVNDPFSLRNLSVLYRAVITGKGISEDYQPPRVYDRHDQLVPDPYYLQEPLCVLCLNDPNNPPLTDDRRELLAKTHLNAIFLNRPWLYWINAPVDECPAAPDGWVCIGTSGGYAFYVKKDRLQYFIDFVLMTLPLQQAPARFTSITPPGQPGAPPPKRGAPETIPRLVPGPAEGTQRPNLLIVPQILQVPQ